MIRRPARIVAGLALAVAVGLAVSGASAPVRAQTTPAPETERVCLRFEGPWTDRLIAIVESDLRTAFGRRRIDVCRDAGTSGPLLTLAITSETLDRIALTLTGPAGTPSGSRIDRQIGRQIDLGSFPADGRVLAVVVAADELLQASREQPGAPAPAAAPPAAASSTASGVPAVEARASAPGRPARGALTAAFALERYAGGQTQLGPEIAGRLALSRRWFVLAAVQARRGLTADATEGAVESRLLGGRLALGAVLAATAGGRVSLGAEAGARVGRLRYEGIPGAGTGFVGEAIGSWLAYADATLALEARVAGPLALRLAAGLGVPLLAQVAAAKTTGPVTAASGLALQACAGAVLLF